VFVGIWKERGFGMWVSLLLVVCFVLKQVWLACIMLMCHRISAFLFSQVCICIQRCALGFCLQGFVQACGCDLLSLPVAAVRLQCMIFVVLR
jgi:hypothetical protein